MAKFNRISVLKSKTYHSNNTVYHSPQYCFKVLLTSFKGENLKNDLLKKLVQLLTLVCIAHSFKTY